MHKVRNALGAGSLLSRLLDNETREDAGSVVRALAVNRVPGVSWRCDKRKDLGQLMIRLQPNGLEKAVAGTVT